MENNQDKNAYLAVATGGITPAAKVEYVAEKRQELAVSGEISDLIIEPFTSISKEDSKKEHKLYELPLEISQHRPDVDFLMAQDPPLQSQYMALLQPQITPPKHPPIATPKPIAPPPEHHLPSPPSPVTPPPPEATPPETPTPINVPPDYAQLKNQYLHDSERAFPPLEVGVLNPQQLNQLTNAIASFSPTAFANIELISGPNDPQTSTITISEAIKL